MSSVRARARLRQAGVPRNPVGVYAWPPDDPAVDQARKALSPLLD
jgi:hypothetical protein